MSEHWTATAKRVWRTGLLVAEDDDGTLLAPSRVRADWWEPLNLRRPRHLAAWINSRIRNEIVMVDRSPEASPDGRAGRGAGRGSEARSASCRGVEAAGLAQVLLPLWRWRGDDHR